VEISNFLLEDAIINRYTEDDLLAIKKKIECVDNEEYNFIQICLLGAGLTGYDERYEKSRGVISYHQEVGCKTLKEYLVWYLKAKELTELFDIIENFIKKVLLKNNKVMDHDFYKNIVSLIDVKSFEKKYLNKKNDTLKVFCKYSSKLRNVIIHNLGIVTKNTCDEFGSMKNELIKMEEVLSIYESIIKDNIDKKTGNSLLFEYKFCVGCVIQINNNFLNFFRNIIIHLSETIEFEYS
jgi:hypothetical protein